MDKIYIPKRLNCGYNKRGDTYSGKLAYIIYWDDKGKLRKENSWRGWIEEELGTNEYDNVPTEGFVLNRPVGGVRQSYGWDARIEKVRVFDPRGFEIEITMENLLFILQETNSIVGKGLEGEFVYGWAGTALILMPVKSKEYQDSKNYTTLQSTKVGKSDMVPGCTYTTKDMDKLLYLGRFDFYGTESCMLDNVYSYQTSINKVHIFKNLNYVEPQPDPVFETDEEEEAYYDAQEYITHNTYDKYITHKGFTKISVRNTDTPADDYADLLEEFYQSEKGSAPKQLHLVPKQLHEILEPVSRDTMYDRDNNTEYYRIENGNFVKFSISEEWDWSYNSKENTFKGYSLSTGNDKISLKDGRLISKYVYDSRNKKPKYYTIEEIKAMEFFDLIVELESGKMVPFNEFGF